MSRAFWIKHHVLSYIYTPRDRPTSDVPFFFLRLHPPLSPSIPFPWPLIPGYSDLDLAPNYLTLFLSLPSFPLPSMPIFSFLSFLSFFLSFYSFFSSILFRIRHLCSCPKEVTSNTFRPWDNIVRVFSYHRRFPFCCSQSKDTQNRLLPSPASPRSSFPSSCFSPFFFFFFYFWGGGRGKFLFSAWSVGTL